MSVLFSTWSRINISCIWCGISQRLVKLLVWNVFHYVTLYIFTSPLVGVQYRILQSMCLSVRLSECVSVCMDISKNGLADFTKFPFFVAPGHGLVLFLWHCSMLCSSTFVDYIMFAHNQSSKGDANCICIQSDWQGQIRTGISRCSQLPCCFMISFLILDCFYFFFILKFSSSMYQISFH